VANRILIIAGILLVTLPVVSGASRLQDPMRPSHVPSNVEKKAVEKTSEWRLSAVLLSADRSVAVINDRAMSLGDRIDGYKLIQVDADRVVLVRNKKTVVLRRPGTGLKMISAPYGAEKGSHL